MRLKRVTGNNKQTQRLVDVEIASAIKSSNQTNPRSGGTTLVVCGQTNGINTQQQSTDTTGTMEQCTKPTSEQLTLMDCQSMTLSVADFLANLSRLLESGEDSMTLEALCSLKSCASLGLAEASIYSLRTSKDCLITRAGLRFKPLSQRWMNWGMTVNGRCLTAKPMYPKTGSGYSLSQILEENPDSRYFLSEKQTQRIQKVMEGEAKRHQQDIIYNPETDTPNLPAGTHGSTPHLMKIWQTASMQTTEKDGSHTDK